MNVPRFGRFVWMVLALAPGCVRAPEVAVVSQHTALERQAAGEYPAQEQELDAAAIAPGPTTIPREQLNSGGEATGLGVVDDMMAKAESDEERLDGLLLARCVGEARNGLCEVTLDRCQQEVDAGELTRLVGRINVHRRQIWTFVAQRSPGTSEAQAREQWRALHMQRVVCGGQVQAEDGRWEAKACAE
jgi:hypothetical protein